MDWTSIARCWVRRWAARAFRRRGMIDHRILNRYAGEFWSQVGVHLSRITVPYPEYKFQYTSAGGNSGQTTVICLNTPTLDALSTTLAEKIRWTKSAAGQRALMTARRRKDIKNTWQFYLPDVRHLDCR